MKKVFLKRLCVARWWNPLYWALLLAAPLLGVVCGIVAGACCGVLIGFQTGIHGSCDMIDKVCGRL